VSASVFMLLQHQHGHNHMTNLEALKALTEYRGENDNLFTKTLLDNGVTSGGTYAATDEQSIDMTLADIYMTLAGHPDMNDGRWGVKYSVAKLLELRKSLYGKWGIALPEITSQVKVPSVYGKTSPNRNAHW